MHFSTITYENKISEFLKKTIGLEDEEPLYELAFTNYEIKRMFRKMVKGWFKKAGQKYNFFVQSLLSGDIEGFRKGLFKVAKRKLRK